MPQPVQANPNDIAQDLKNLNLCSGLLLAGAVFSCYAGIPSGVVTGMVGLFALSSMMQRIENNPTADEDVRQKAGDSATRAVRSFMMVGACALYQTYQRLAASESPTMASTY